MKLIKPRIEKNNTNRYNGLYQCLCGSMCIKTETKVKTGAIRDCGCGIRARNKPDETINKLKGVLKSAIQRCENSSSENYKHYGKRGIVVCKEWKDDKESFIVWALLNGYKEGLSIDRINNNKGYSPSNCRWVTQYTQVHNRRPFKRRFKYKPTMRNFDWCI